MSSTPFVRDREVDSPAIIGARWWQKTLADPMPRRRAIQSILVVSGIIAGFGLILGLAAKASRPDFELQKRNALETQREYGWSFGAATESLVFDGSSLMPFDPTQLRSLANDVRPASAKLLPYHVETLFESLTATPRSVTKEPETIAPLIDALKPIQTPKMKSAYASAVEVSRSLGDSKSTFVIVDLDGAEAVAFAAGLSPGFTPVFLLDNWPHPRGVVPSHLPLAAAAFYQPTFAKHAAIDDSKAVLVLDRKRLAIYSDDSTQFDNRYVAKAPLASALGAQGISTVVYVVPHAADRELDDLNDDFVAYSAAGIVLRVVACFDSADLANRDTGGVQYRPTPRATAFSGRGAGPRATPVEFGMVPVAVAVGTGILLGAKLNRSGSWNRSGGTGGG